MVHWAKPGIKCVCVENGTWYNPASTEISGPSKDEVSTITGVVEIDGKFGLGLGGYDGYYPIEQFRPLVSQEHDVALFTHHLIAESVDA